MRWGVLLVWMAVWLGVAGAQQELGAVLHQHGIPETAWPESARGQRITSFATSDDRPGQEVTVAVPRTTPFLMAYYDDDGTGTLKAPLHLLRYRPAVQRMQGGDLRGVDQVVSEVGTTVGVEAHLGVSRQLSNDCLGSALSITQGRGWVGIETHLSPSAACLLVWDTAFRFRYAVSGFRVGSVGRATVVEGNTIHFAPTHPLILGVLEPVRGTLDVLYPMKKDQRRTKFKGALRHALQGQSSECRAEDLPCNPDSFEGNLEMQDSDPKHGCFAFAVTMDTVGFPEAVHDAVPAEEVQYRSCLVGGRWKTSVQGREP